MASNSERIQEHTSRIEDVVNQIITAGGFVFVDTPQTITGQKTFMETVGVANQNGTIDYLKHIDNNFLLSTNTGRNLLNIDEGLNKIYAFNKELAFKDDLIDAGGGTTVTVGSSAVDSLSFDSDPQAQITSISNRVKPAIVNVSHNENTGEFTFTRDNGTSFVVDTLLEKVVTNFTYNENAKNLELVLEDGSIKAIPMTAFIDDYSGTDGDAVTVSISNDNKISAVIKNGTITKEHLSETVQSTLDEVGSNSGKIDSVLSTWDSKADCDASNLSDTNVASWQEKLGVGAGSGGAIRAISFDSAYNLQLSLRQLNIDKILKIVMNTNKNISWNNCTTFTLTESGVTKTTNVVGAMEAEKVGGYTFYPYSIHDGTRPVFKYDECSDFSGSSNGFEVSSVFVALDPNEPTNQPVFTAIISRCRGSEYATRYSGYLTAPFNTTFTGTIYYYD